MRIITVLSLFAFFQTQAQLPYDKSGCLLYTLGKDTTAIGNYELKGHDFSIRVIDFTGPTVVSTLKGTFFPTGELQTAQGEMYQLVPGKETQLLRTYEVSYNNDTTYIHSQTKRGARTEKYPVKIMVGNSLGGYTLVYMPALLVSFAPKKNGDSVSSHHIVFSSARDFKMRKLADGKYSIGSAVMGMFTVYLDQKGNLRSIDGIGTSWNIKGIVVPPLNLDSVIKARMENELAHPQEAIGNKLDSTQTTVNGATIKIRYSRPATRGRTIFGAVVPYDRFWRTGADAATKLTLSQPIHLDGKELPAGEYSIFTLPSKKEWTIMFNKKADIWGTEYHAEDDVLRVPMTVETLPDPVELLTIQVLPATGGGVIEVSWEKTKASIRFSVP